MRIRREHVMATCVAVNSDEENQYWKSVVESYLSEGKQTLISKVPPPEREIIYRVKFCVMDELLTSNTRAVFAFGATESLFLNGRDMKTDVLNAFEGFIMRLIRDNLNLKYYGINLLFLFAPTSGSGLPSADSEDEEIKSSLFSFIYNWCSQVNLATGVVVTFDFVCDEGDLGYVLRNELRRVKHGDMMAQFAGAY
jgi:hypothetical protein